MIKIFFPFIFIFIFIFIFYFSSVAFAYTDTDINRVAGSKYWQRLLHYKSHIIGGWKSSVDGDDFFLSKEGRTSPRDELLATIASFSKEIKIGKFAQHPQCAFPERFRFLNKELQLNIKVVDCILFKEFIEKFKASSVTLVFSSAYPNNPGSMFGHTFLRINAKNNKDEKKIDVLDLGLSYAAKVPDDENNFIFVWNGLSGGYSGQFAVLPYYSKVNEYTNSESRDIWEYALNVNEEETLRLLANVWEIESNSYFDYFFLDENCAYEILTLLEVAKPNWDISPYSVHMIPGESVKRITKIPGAVLDIKYRPSLHKQMLARVNHLNNEERSTFFSIINKEMEMVSNVKILDALIQYLHYQKQKNGKLSADETHFLNLALLKRSKIREISQDIATVGSTQPDLGHHSNRVSVGSGFTRGISQDNPFLDLQYKFAYHDLLNSDLGFVPFSEINFPNAMLRWVPKDKKVFLDQLEFFSVASLSPWGFLEKPLSWKIQIAYTSAKDLNCNYCHQAHIEGNAGATFKISEKLINYNLLGIYFDASRKLEKSWRMSPKWQSAMIWAPNYVYKMHAGVSLIADYLANQSRQKWFSEWRWQNSYSFNQEWEARLLFSYNARTRSSERDFREWKSSINYYF